MRWSPKFKRDVCNEWLSKIEKFNTLKISENVGNFNPPFNILISANIHRDILKIYPPNEEKGGLMFASIEIKHGEIFLKIEHIDEVRNDVEKYFPGTSKTNSYFPNKEQYLKLLNDNFSQVDAKNILLPIHFHTHPTKDKDEDIKYYYQLLHPLNPSKADIEVSNTRHIQLNNFTLLYLNSIITGDDGEHRIMFYGKKVTPENFMREKGIQVVEFIKEITQEINNEDLRLLARIAVGGLATWGAISAPQMIKPMVDDFVYQLDKKEFWGKLEKEKETVIKIPFRELEEK